MAEWQKVRLDAVASDVTVGFVGSMSAEYQDAGVIFLRSQNVLPHRLDTTDTKFINHDFHRRLSKSALQPGDVVTVRTGKPGTSAVIPRDAPEMNCADLVITRPGPLIDSRWLSYYMNSVAAGFISAHLVGAVQQHFNVGAAKAMELRLPPLLEQQAIAEVLKALDDKITANDITAELAHRLSESHFLDATLRAPTRKMSEVFRPILGGTPARTVQEHWTDDVPWASARDVTNAPHGVIIETAEKISQHASTAKRTQALPVGSVILTARGTVGAVARIAVSSSFNQSCYGFRPDGIGESLLYFSILHSVEQAQSFAHGSVFSTITAQTFDHLTVPTLDPETSMRLERILGSMLASVTAVVRENASLAKLRDTLLPPLMSGHLRVKDAEKQVEAVV